MLQNYWSGVHCLKLGDRLIHPLITHIQILPQRRQTRSAENSLILSLVLRSPFPPQAKPPQPHP
ncbi:MAG: hypothetical protein LH679_16525 [Cyanobacteria bacterium CAN_BIN43]|nr:hypothetical protein [Cyanobacteria bacterium CAN_BIN43]